MTDEVNSAIRGARAGGATFFLVNDSHLDMRNLIVDKIDNQNDVKIVSGSPKPLGQMQGLDNTFSGVFLLGYHAKVGTKGAIVDHSYYSSGTVKNIRLNGITVGESVISAAVAGYYGVPVLLVSGDNYVCQEAEEAIPGVRTVCVKEGIARGAGIILIPKQARKIIEIEAKKSIENLIEHKCARPLKLNSPITLQIDMAYTSMVDIIEMMPGIKRVSGRTISFTSQDYLEVYKAMIAIITLAMQSSA
jgi:D-amino peptidase